MSLRLRGNKALFFVNINIGHKCVAVNEHEEIAPLEFIKNKRPDLRWSNKRWQRDVIGHIAEKGL